MKLKINWQNGDDDLSFDAEGDFRIEQAHVLINDVMGREIVFEEFVLTNGTIIVPPDGLSNELLQEIVDRLNGEYVDETADDHEEEPPVD